MQMRFDQSDAHGQTMESLALSLEQMQLNLATASCVWDSLLSPFFRIRWLALLLWVAPTMCVYIATSGVYPSSLIILSVILTTSAQLMALAGSVRAQELGAIIEVTSRCLSCCRLISRAIKLCCQIVWLQLRHALAP